MKRVVLAAAVLVSTSMPVIANADQGVRSVNRATCVEVTVDHPDGSSDSERRCHTSSDGTR